MLARQGFDLAAAQAMASAYGEQPDAAFLGKARSSEFWGLYSPDPVGAVVIETGERPSIHVGCTVPGRSGRAIATVVQDALKRHGKLYANIRLSAPRALRLALWLGFTPIFKNETHVICRRLV